MVHSHKQLRQYQSEDALGGKVLVGGKGKGGKVCWGKRNREWKVPKKGEQGWGFVGKKVCEVEESKGGYLSGREEGWFIKGKKR